jgi:hypothetical protein
VGAGQIGVFVDGGVSMANNPALQLFLMSTLKGFRFNWQTGEDKLLLVSVGTGAWKPIPEWTQSPVHPNSHGPNASPSVLMEDANHQINLSCSTYRNLPRPGKLTVKLEIWPTIA